jgi:hypothetical protein
MNIRFRYCVACVKPFQSMSAFENHGKTICDACIASVEPIPDTQRKPTIDEVIRRRARQRRRRAAKKAAVV